MTRKDNMNTVDLFATPIYFNNIKIKKEYKDILIKEKYERFKIDNGFSTINKYVLNNKKLNSLKKEIINNLNNYIYEILKIKKTTKFKLLNSWCTKHSYNDWAQAHHHENSLISGVLYLKTYEDSGNESVKHFSVKISIDGEQVAKGRATSKKKAEEQASKRVYYAFQNQISMS